MELSRRTHEVVADHWAKMQGCDPTDFETPGTTVVTTGSSEVSMTSRDSSVVVAALDHLTQTVRKRLDDLLQLAEGDGDRAAALLDEPVSEVLGPQFLGYADEGTFTPVERGARLLDANDADALARLESACPDEEWERGGMGPFELGEDTIAGSFMDGTLAAAAAYQEVHPGIVGISVIAHPDHRGEGRAKAVVSRATSHAFEQGFEVVEYRTLERWESSVGLATDLGFERWGQSRLVKLAEWEQC